MKKIAVMGVGSLGSFLTLALCQDLPLEHEIIVLDYDIVEERNIRNQVYSPRYIGYPKVEALQDIVFSDYEREIQIINKKLEYEDGEIFDLMEKADIVVDCFDNFLSRSIIQEYWHDIFYKNRSKVKILHVGFSEKMTFEISWAEAYSVPSDITSGFDICTEPGAGSFIRMVSALSSQVVQEFLTTGKKKEFIGNKFSFREIT